MSVDSPGLIKLLTGESTDARVLTLGPGRLSDAGSLEEVIQSEFSPAPGESLSVLVVISRRRLPRTSFELSLLFRSPDRLAGVAGTVTGMRVAGCYLLWPSSDEARFAFDAASARTSIRWAWRVGALGRSGRSRLDLRNTPLYTELVYRMSGVAIHLVPS